jgi:hypothetical protein
MSHPGIQAHDEKISKKMTTFFSLFLNRFLNTLTAAIAWRGDLEQHFIPVIANQTTVLNFD